MYFKEILMYLLWPLLISVSWILVKFFLRLYEKGRQETEL